MCDASLVTMGAGAATSAVGKYYTAQGQQLALRAQANVADLNAKLSEDSARVSMQQGEQAQVNAKLRTGQIEGAQRVGFAAGGVDLGEGNAAAALTSTEAMGEIDALTINQNAVREAGAKRIQATNYRNEALTGRATASAIDPFGSALTSLLGSASQFAMANYKMKTK